MKILVNGKPPKFMPGQEVFVVPMPRESVEKPIGKRCELCGIQSTKARPNWQVKKIVIGSVQICEPGHISYGDMDYWSWKEHEVHATQEEAERWINSRLEEETAGTD